METHEKVIERINNARDNRATFLDLSNCFLKEIPPQVFELDKLTELNLKENRIKFIHPDISKLHRLRKLQIYGNKWLRNLPDSFSELKYLEFLNLSYNRFKEIPNSVFKLTELKELYFNGNQIAHIPRQIRNLVNLEYLKISNNKIEGIPKELGRLPSLKQLILTANNLTIIRKNNFVSETLRYLKLDNNNIKGIEASAFKCKNLFDLNLANNNLIALPKQLGYLPQIEILRLNNNLFESLPPVIAEFEKLNWINLKENPLKNKKEFAIETNTKDRVKEIQNYLRRNYSINFTVKDLHQEVFKYLKDTYHNYKFQLSTQKGRLKKGLFLLGNEKNCIVSFWDGIDRGTKKPYIYWEVDLSGNITQCISAVQSKDKETLSLIAKVLGYYQEKEKGQLVNIWKKDTYIGRNLIYSTIVDYFDYLDEYINVELPIIDRLLPKEGIGDLKFINLNEFKNRLQSISKQEFVVSDLPQNAQIHLKQLSLQNIGHFQSISIDLSKPVTCLIGENGMGKTTILRAILLALTGIDETTKIDATNSNLQKMLRLENYDYLSTGNIILDYSIQTPFQNQIQFKSISDGKISIEDIHLDNNIESFGAIYEDDNFRNLVIGFAQLQTENAIKNQNSSNKYKYIQPRVNDIINLIYNQPNNHFESLFDWIYTLYNTNQNKDNQNEPANAKYVIDLIFEVISHIMNDEVSLDKVSAYNKEIWIKTGKSGDVIPFELLSQGFKNVFAWIGHFIRRLAEANSIEKDNGFFDFSTDLKEQYAIVLIDEVATYLHPKWQRNILRSLVDIFPKAQFIITTHSPLVISNLETATTNVYLLKKNEARQLKHFYGRDIRDIMNEFYGVTARPKEITNLIDRLFYLIETEKQSEAQELFETLKTYLGQEDGAIIDAQTSFELMDI